MDNVLSSRLFHYLSSFFFLYFAFATWWSLHHAGIPYRVEWRQLPAFMRWIDWLDGPHLIIAAQGALLFSMFLTHGQILFSKHFTWLCAGAAAIMSCAVLAYAGKLRFYLSAVVVLVLVARFANLAASAMVAALAGIAAIPVETRIQGEIGQVSLWGVGPHWCLAGLELQRILFLSSAFALLYVLLWARNSFNGLSIVCFLGLVVLSIWLDFFGGVS